MQETVFSPLEMMHSSYSWPKRKAMGYDSDSIPVLPQDPMPKPNAAFTLHTTASDYAKFIQAILKSKALKAKTIDEMLTPHIFVGEDGPCCLDKCSGKLSPIVSWGLGWGLQQISDELSFWHWGSNKGAKCYIAGFKDGAAIVIFTNSDNGLNAIPEIIYEITGVRHPALKWLKYD